MRYTVGAFGKTKIGNFSIITQEDYALFPTIDVEIRWHYVKKWIFGEIKLSKSVYKGRCSDKNLQKAREQIQEKVNEKLPLFIKMEREGRL